MSRGDCIGVEDQQMATDREDVKAAAIRWGTDDSESRRERYEAYQESLDVWRTVTSLAQEDMKLLARFAIENPYGELEPLKFDENGVCDDFGYEVFGLLHHQYAAYKLRHGTSSKKLAEFHTREQAIRFCNEHHASTMASKFRKIGEPIRQEGE